MFKKVNAIQTTDTSNLVQKADYNRKIKKKIFKKNVTSIKTRHLEAEKELNELSKKVELLSTKRL